MATVNADVELPASAEKVWSVLPDLNRFDAWLTIQEGQMVVGALGKAVENDAKKNLDESMAKLASLVG